jgi:hypothetical protein
MARVILEEMFQKGVSPEAVIERKGLNPIQDSGALPAFSHRPGHEEDSRQGRPCRSHQTHQEETPLISTSPQIVLICTDK